VKARVFQYLPLCVFLLAACGPTASRSPADAITFDTLRGLDDFEFATAGDGKPGEWSILKSVARRIVDRRVLHLIKMWLECAVEETDDRGRKTRTIIENDAGRVLGQIDTDPADNRFPLAIYQPFSGRDVYVSIRFMTISGETDQAAGIFVRFASVDDYYVARASALENNVGLSCRRRKARDDRIYGGQCVGPSMAHSWHRGERRTPHDIFRRQGAFCRGRQEVSGGLPAKLACGPKPTA
jgi:hypothetical protein